jgi:hypothetical protein
MTELPIPPVALEDNNSFELLRVWAAFEEQHVSIHPGLNGSWSRKKNNSIINCCQPGFDSFIECCMFFLLPEQWV